MCYTVDAPMQPYSPVFAVISNKGLNTDRGGEGCLGLQELETKKMNKIKATNVTIFR